MVSKSLKFDLKWQFLFFKPILSAIIVTIATANLNKCQIFTLQYLLINQSKKKGEKQFSVFGSRGGQISPLMHVPLWKVGEEGERGEKAWVENKDREFQVHYSVHLSLGLQPTRDDCIVRVQWFSSVSYVNIKLNPCDFLV